MKKNTPEEPKKEEIILYRSMDEVMHDSMIPTRSTSFWSGPCPGWRTA